MPSQTGRRGSDRCSRLIVQWWAMAERRSTRCGFGLRPRRISLIFRSLVLATFVGALGETLQAESLTRILYCPG